MGLTIVEVRKSGVPVATSNREPQGPGQFPIAFLFVNAGVAVAVVSFFSLTTTVLALAVLVGVLGFFVAKRSGGAMIGLFSRKRSTGLPSVAAPARQNGRGDAVFYAANGLFATPSRFLKEVGTGEIRAGTLSAGRQLETLRTDWDDFNQKVAVNAALNAAVDRIQNEQLLGKMAQHLDVSAMRVAEQMKRQTSKRTVLTKLVKAALAERFNALTLAIVDTQRGGTID